MLAELGTPPPADTNAWLMVAAGVMAIYWLGRQIFLSHFPIQKDAERFVTHAQLDERLASIKEDLREMKQEVLRTNAGVTEKFEKLDAYLHDTAHRSAGAMQHLLTDVAWMKGLMEGAQKLKMAQVGES